MIDVPGNGFPQKVGSNNSDSITYGGKLLLLESFGFFARAGGPKRMFDHSGGKQIGFGHAVSRSLWRIAECRCLTRIWTRNCPSSLLPLWLAGSTRSLADPGPRNLQAGPAPMDLDDYRNARQSAMLRPSFSLYCEILSRGGRTAEYRWPVRMGSYANGFPREGNSRLSLEVTGLADRLSE